jgi:hypothetical protein
MAAIAASAAMAAGSGCTTLIKSDEDGRWIPVPAGGTLTLARAVTVPPGRARVFFVNGRLQSSSASYRTSCALEIRGLDRTAAQRIPAGSLRIVRVQNYWTEVVALPDPAPRLLPADYGGDTGHSMIRTGFHFWFEDEPPGPGPMRLTCVGIMADPPDADPPTLAEIRDALGDLARLEVVTEPEES